LERNLGCTIEVVVILIQVRRVRGVYCCGEEDKWRTGL
jgi:hypothetical protein